MSVFCAHSNQGYAEDEFPFEILVMPGEVIEAHAEYEQKCANCHETFRQASLTKLCLDCHEDIAADIKQVLGFHGRMTEAPNRECTDCHTDHIGRQGDIVNLDKDGFDHKQTDFELKGKHSGVLCASCHLPDKKYRDAQGQCFACHETDDRHQGLLGKECQDCHSAKAWNDARFDHSDTKFALLGRHQKTQCNACHPDEKYSETPTACFSCHALNDVHDGVNGEQCSKCHTESGWQEISFDHDKDTDFKLKDGHDNLSCNSCHQTSGFDEKLSTDCVDCHQKDDEHNGRNGQQCDSCHVIIRWDKTTFDHARDTDFTLHGKHSELSCESCHRERMEDSQLGTACIDCHQVDDVHNEQQGRQCENCHNPSGWLEQLRFNHDLTTFPLVGMHAVTTCESCHTSKLFRDAKSDCVECHKNEDTHDRSLGTNCAACHNPNDWRLWLFDHDTQTDFELDGAHEGLSCNACHIEPTNDKVKQSSACVDCHLLDDVHNRRFGRACDRCHVAESFKNIRIQ